MSEKKSRKEIRFGRYEVVRRIGRGAVGEVFLARDPSLDRLVAVKTLSSLDALEPREQEEARLRFLREARAAAGLSHPNIVTVFDVGAEGPVPYMAMEYLEGTTLDRHAKPGHLLPPQKVLEIGAQAAHALHAAHLAGVVHRDVKPANLVLLEDGKLKVADFGLAKNSRVAMTSDETILGTPYYMSPEQIAGRELDGRSDLFSLAVTIHELLSGTLPFPGDTISTVLYRVVNEPPIPIRRQRAELPESLERLLARAMSKGPSGRLASCAELADAFADELRSLGGLQSDLRMPEPSPVAAARMRRTTGAQSRTSPKGQSEKGRGFAPGRWLFGTALLLAVAAGVAWTAPTWLGFDPLGERRRPAEDWLSARLGPVGDALRITPPDALVPLITVPEGLVASVEPTGYLREGGAALEIPAGATGTVTVSIDEPCLLGSETFDADDPPPELRLETRAKSVSVPVATDPSGARVEIDGVLVEGATPLEASLTLCAEHVVGISVAGRPTKEITLAADGGAESWAAQLADVKLDPPPPGKLVVPRAPYPVRVTLARGGRSIGAAGSTLSLSPGRYRLVLVAKDVLYRKPIEAVVRSGGSTRMDVDYPPLGTISVRAIPPGGSVAARGGGKRSFTTLGETPINARKVVVGAYDVTVSHPARDSSVSRRIEVSPGGESVVTVGAGDWP